MISNDVLAAGMHAFIFIAPYKHAHTCLLMCGDMTTLCLTARLMQVASHTPFPSMHSCASGIRSSNGGLPSPAKGLVAHRTKQFLQRLHDNVVTEES